ncbi:protein TASOR 2 isoform X2 [Xenopus laevis]|uniref:Protein TASOR 2 isoform X2 n=2 Tax=Xenopus laevis TaxID=8355 RepID=A0A1L8GTP6_XENLA|nr:protein TASOR 2 isoform X2 [Xenopus laevis]OCT87207.1 hypothetical protein XELAEV_18020904mg [Xenopus laevis]
MVKLHHEGYYNVWKGQMYFQDQLMCDIVFQSTVNFGIPAQLSNKLEIKEVIKLPELIQKLPKGTFSKRALTGQEACFENIYYSAYQVITSNVVGLELDKLQELMKEKELALVKFLNDQGVLILLSSSVFEPCQDLNQADSSCLTALFLFPHTKSLGKREQEECKRKFAKEDISLKVAPLLPGLQYAILETNRSCKGKDLYPKELIKQYLKTFSQQKNMESTSKRKADLANTTYTLSGKCSQLDFSRLSSYISNPVNFSVPLQKASKLLAEEPANSNNDNLNNKDFKISDCETNVAFSSESKFKTENKNPPNGKQESKTFNAKDSNPIKEEKARVNIDEETHLPQSQAPPIQRTEKSYTNKNHFHPSGEHKHVSSASTTTVKLASTGINRRKRGAEVLTAEFVQVADTEKMSKEVSGKSKTGDVKNTADGSNLIKQKSKTVNQGGVKDKDAALKRKTSEPAKNTKLESKMKAKSLKRSVEKNSDKSMKKSIRSMEKVKKNSHKVIKSLSWSGEKPKQDNTKCDGAGNLMEKRISMYESHALNLLADLALNSFSSSAALFPSTNAASDSQASKNGTDILVKGLHSENRCNTARACSPPTQPSVSLHTITTESDEILNIKHDEPKRDNESCYMNNSSMIKAENNLKRTINAAVAKTKNNILSKICQEHSYSQPPMNEPKVDPLVDKTNEKEVKTLHDPTVKASMVLDQPQNPACLPRKNIHMNLKKGPRAVLQFGDGLKITLKWDAKYDFDLDSKFTCDSLEKTVNRALHGPWNLSLREKVEEVRIILHMWVALFYSKSNKALNCSSRKVVEHSNPAKFVSISTIREPIKMGKIREAENMFDMTSAAGSQNSKLLIPIGNEIQSNYSQRYDCVKKENRSCDEKVILPVPSQEKDTEQMHINENVLSAFQKKEMQETDKYKKATGVKPVNTCIPILCYVRDTNQIDAVSDQNENSCSSITGCTTEKGGVLEKLLSKNIISDKKQETNIDDVSFQKADAVTSNNDASISPEKFDSNICSNDSKNKHHLDTDDAILDQETGDIDPEFDEAEQDRPASPKKDKPCSEAFEAHKHFAVLKGCEREENKSKSNVKSSQSLQEEILEMCGIPQVYEHEEKESRTADSRDNVEYGGRDGLDPSESTRTNLNSSHKTMETCAGNKENVDETMECSENDNKTNAIVTDFSYEVDSSQCKNHQKNIVCLISALENSIANTAKEINCNQSVKSDICEHRLLEESRNFMQEQPYESLEETSALVQIESTPDKNLLSTSNNGHQEGIFERQNTDVNTVPLQSTEHCRKDQTARFEKNVMENESVNGFVTTFQNVVERPTEKSVVSPTKESLANDAVSDKLNESEICREQHSLDNSTHVEMCMDCPELATELFSLNETDCAVQFKLTEKTEGTILCSNDQKSSILLSIEDNRSCTSFSEETNKAYGFMDDANASTHFSQTESNNACQENLALPQTVGMQIACENSKEGILNKNESNSHVANAFNVQPLPKSNENKLITEEKQYPLILKQECAVYFKDVYPGQSNSTQNINAQAEKANENKTDLLHVYHDYVHAIKDKGIDALSEDLTVNPEEEKCAEMQKEVNLTVNENLSAPGECASADMIAVFSEEKVQLEKQCLNETFDCSTFLAHPESPKQGDLVLGSEERYTVEIQEANDLTTNENSGKENIVFSGDELVQVKQYQAVSFHSNTSAPLSESLKQPFDVIFQDKYTLKSPKSLDVCLTAGVNAESDDYWSDNTYEDVAFAQEPGNPYKPYSCHPSSDHESTSLHKATYSTKVRHTRHYKRTLDVYDVPLDDEEYIPKYFRHQDVLRRRKYENVTVSRYFLETDRPSHRKSGSTNKHEPFNIFKKRRIESDSPTQSTLDLEHLRFNHRLKRVLKNASMETDIFEPPSRTMFESKRIPCCSGSSKIKHPLLITIQHSDHKRDGVEHRRWHNSTYSSQVINEYQLKGRSAHSCRNTKKVNEYKKTTFHLQQLKYGNRSKKANDDDISVILKECAQSTHLKLSRVRSGDPLTDHTTSRNVREACSRQTFDPDAQNPCVVKDIISDLCTTLHCKLHNVANQSNRRSFHFYVNETSDDHFFSSVKNLLNQAGHTVSDPQQFCDSNEASEEMFVIIRNEDISVHIHKIPCLLQLRLLPNVTFAGVDNPEDIMDSSFQELFQSGGFVVSDQTVMDSIRLDKLKDILRLLKKMNKTSGWKWLIHYRESRKLKDDKRMGSVSQRKSSLLKSYQLRNLIEVLPYHICDSKKKEASDELSCILNLQNQRIHSRLAVYLTDKPRPVREEYQQYGILVLDVDRFIRRIQKLDAELHSCR